MWQISMVLMLRALIDDLECTKYTDSRLKQLLAVGAYSVLTDADFTTDYNVDVARVIISPDPIDNNDANFVVLTVYKTACIMYGSEVKTQAGNAIAIKDGPSSIDLRGIAVQLRDLQKDMCTKYTELLDKHRYDSSSLNGQAILGPYSPGSLGLGSASMLDYYNGLRQGNFF